MGGSIALLARGLIAARATLAGVALLAALAALAAAGTGCSGGAGGAPVTAASGSAGTAASGASLSASPSTAPSVSSSPSGSASGAHAVWPSAAALAATERWLRARSGVTAFAVVDSRGRIHGYGYDVRYPSASVVKAMLLVQYLRTHAGIPARERFLLARMIVGSDNAATDRVFAQVGTGGLGLEIDAQIHLGIGAQCRGRARIFKGQVLDVLTDNLESGLVVAAVAAHGCRPLLAVYRLLAARYHGLCV